MTIQASRRHWRREAWIVTLKESYTSHCFSRRELVITHKWARLRKSALLDECGPEILSAAKDDSLSIVILSAAKDLSSTYG